MTDTSSYLDTTTLLSPSFSPYTHANTLILATNNASDTPLDLATPLSRALFDSQDVTSRLDALTTAHAAPLLSHTAERAEASQNVLDTLEEQVRSLQASYERLEKEVGERYERAEEVRLVVERMSGTLRLGRGVQRALGLGRQLQGLVEEVGQPVRGAERSMVPAATTLLALREIFGAEEGKALGRVQVVSTLRNEVVAPAERTLLQRAQSTVGSFSMSSLSAGAAGGGGGGGGGGAGVQTFKDAEAMKGRATAALQTLYLLSPTTSASPTLLLTALSSYLQTALTSSLASLARALATLPTLDRTLLEVSARCQNICALEALLSTTTAPSTSTSTSTSARPSADLPSNFLEPLLRHLDTTSLPSYFWRSLASQLSSRVQEILSRGGVSARTLRSNREKVREAVRECVERGSRLPSTTTTRDEGGKGKGVLGNWEREAAVMVGAVVGPLR